MEQHTNSVIQYIRYFFLCGITGWTLECFWTGLCAVILWEDPMLLCKTSVWMFPIYGLAVLILPVSRRLTHRPFYYRGIVYMILIFSIEFLAGGLLNMIHACPWNYSNAPFNIMGVIRPDYAPLWFLMGLIYEKVLNNRRFLCYT